MATLPVHEERIFQHKFQHAVLLSSWGCRCWAARCWRPTASVARAPWYYYAMVLPMLVAFVFIPAASARSCCWRSCTCFRKPERSWRWPLILRAGHGSSGRSSRGRRPSSLPTGSRTCCTPRAARQGEPLPTGGSAGPAGSGGRPWSESVLFWPADRQRPVLPRTGGDAAARFTGLLGDGRHGPRPTRARMGWFDRGLNFALGFSFPRLR